MNKLIDPLLRMSRLRKGAIVLLADLLACPASVWLAFYFRLGEWSGFLKGFEIATVASLAIALPLYLMFGLYRVVLRHATWRMLVDIVRAMVIYGIIFAGIFTIIGVSGVPRTVGLIQPILLFMGIGCSRALFGYWFGVFYRNRNREGAETKVLIYGAGAAGRQLAHALSYSGSFRLVGFVDDARELQGRKLGDIAIHGPQDLASLIKSRGIEEVFLAIPSARRSRRNQLMKVLYDHDVRVRTLPGLMDLASGKVEVTDLRPLAIEDLLGREVVAPEHDLLTRDITGKTIVITGAGGSIGSELTRQIYRLNPARIVLVEISEYALYEIHHELEKTRNDASVEIVPLLASVRDKARIDEILATWKPDTIYHAAAYKHVPLVESNPVEGVLNNVFGTLAMAEAAQRHGAEKFVLISTDKAVRPTSVMGTSKRVAEMILQAMAQIHPRPCFTMVRFGNVLGSSGSVVPLFRKQIEMGGPITITHKEIIRYFMTIPEAAQLVIQAGALAQGGEVFVLDMGEPVRIVDLARNMVELSGLVVKDEKHPDGDIEICEVGLRPGEKLYEELLIGDNPEPTIHARIMKANETFIAIDQLLASLANIDRAAKASDAETVKQLLKKLVPEFNPEGLADEFLRQRQASFG